MKWKALILVIIALGASAYFYQVDVMDETTGDTSTQMGFPFPWLEATSTTEGNVTSTKYNVLWEGLLIDIAVYTSLALLLGFVI